MRPRALRALALAAAVLLGACGGDGAPAAGRAAHGRSPGVGVGRLLISWERGRGPRERVLVGTAGVALGLDGGPLTRYLFASPERAADARFLAATFAPFEADTGEGRLRFAGSGRLPASPAERRMVAEWTRLAAAEAAGGRAGAAYGLALAWHRGGGAAGGECEDVAVYLTGEARASSCGWGEELRGRLSASALARLYRWTDRYRAIQTADEGEDSAGLTSRLIFAGQGAAEAPESERAAMEQLAAGIHRELAARRRAQPAPAEGTEPAAEGAKPPAAPPTPPPPAERLLRPPDPAPGRPAEVIVPESALPKEPPPVPPPAPDGAIENR